MKTLSKVINKLNKNPCFSVKESKLLIKNIIPKIPPVGESNSKVATTSTYRPTKQTCPSYCEFNGDNKKVKTRCYAQKGFVNIHNRNSEGFTPEEYSISAFIAIHVAHNKLAAYKNLGIKKRSIARLHTSGDFYRTEDKVIDQEYIDGLIYISKHMKRLHNEPIAYTYTHVKESGIVDVLSKYGIIVRKSGDNAITKYHSYFKRKSGIYNKRKYVLCPVQTTSKENKINCMQCGICWEKPQTVVVFNPH